MRRYEVIDVGLETEAAGITYCQASTVPGLLQTPGYARAMHEVGDRPMRLEVVLDEAVLRRVVGCGALMNARLEKIIHATCLANVTLQVVPFSVGTHPAMDDTFSILEFAGSVVGEVYVEGP